MVKNKYLRTSVKAESLATNLPTVRMQRSRAALKHRSHELEPSKKHQKVT